MLYVGRLHNGMDQIYKIRDREIAFKIRV